MKVTIDQDAIQYILENGKYATILYSKKGWCHSGFVDVPVIRLGKPQSNLDDYQKHDLEKVILYFPKKLETERQEIIVSVAKLFKWRKLTLEGY